MQFCSTQQCEYALPQNVLESSEIQMPSYSEYAVVVPMMSALEGFHCPGPSIHREAV